jgi:hypothetical protein
LIQLALNPGEKYFYVILKLCHEAYVEGIVEIRRLSPHLEQQHLLDAGVIDLS